MMYDELIYWMRYCSDDKPICEKMYDCPFYDESENNSAYYLCGERMLKKAADAIEELSKLADAIPHVCECCIGCEMEKKNGGCDNSFVLSSKRSIQYLIKPRWISVTERLPKNKNMVLATVDGVVYIAFYGNYMWEEVETYSIFYPTHWMPIPEPPKEG